MSTLNLKAFTDTQIELLATAYGASKVNYRDSKHSFTGAVLECYFNDAELAVSFSEEMKLQIGYFTTIRVVDEDTCYVSVPCIKISF